MKLSENILWGAKWLNVVRLARSLGVVAPVRARGPRRQLVITEVVRRANGAR